MASPSTSLRYRCEICGEPIGIVNRGAHWRAVHPELLAVRRRAARAFYLAYFPIAMAFLIFAGVAIVLQAWWWRFGFLAGIYALVAVLLLYGIREWKVEKPIRLAVVRSCPICDLRVTTSDLARHRSGSHPDIWKHIRRSYLLVVPGLYLFIIYAFAWVTALVIVPLPQWVWDAGPLILIAPIFVWMAVVAVAAFVLDRKRLQPARMNWRMLRP